MRFLKVLFTRFCIPVIVLVCVWISANLKGGEHWKYTILSDGKGYYAYLPATFIYHDLNLGFYDSIEARYYDEHTKYDFRSGADGKVIDKYFAGVAVMQAPFFLAGHAATLMSDEPADGYSKYYVMFICLGAIFWLAIGLHYLRQFLRLHRASEGRNAFVLYVIFFGTNLFYYTLVEPTMSHLYSFSLVSMFLYFGKRWIDFGEKKYALKTAFVLGMIFLVRPVNVLIVFWLVYEAGGVVQLWNRLKPVLLSARTAMTGILLFAFPVCIQLVIWKIQTGNWFVNSYGEEAFHFGQPHMIDFLFSYKKGLFVYLPITFVALFGLIPLWKKDRKRTIMAGVFFFGIVYVLSCWWMWYYGGSFGTRVIIEFLPVIALLLYFLIDGIKKIPLRVAVISLVVVLTLFCQFQTIQYRYLMIHWSEMNAEKYWEVFGKMP